MGCSPTRLLCPWDFPDKNTGMGCHFLLQGIFPTGVKPASPTLAGRFFTTVPQGKPNKHDVTLKCNTWFWFVHHVQLNDIIVMTGIYKSWMLLLSRFSHVRFFATQWTIAHQTPLSMGFSRQEYWSGLPCPLPPGDLPDPGIKPTTPALQADSLPTEPPGKPQCNIIQC